MYIKSEYKIFKQIIEWFYLKYNIEYVLKFYFLSNDIRVRSYIYM